MSKKKVKPPKDRGNVFLYGTIIFLVVFIIGGAIYVNKKQEAALDENATQATTAVTTATYNKEKKNEKKTEKATEAQTEAESKTEKQTSETTKPSLRIKVTIDTLKVRSKPSEDGEILDLVDEDDEFDVIKKEGDWYLINSGSGEGYVNAEFVTEVEQ